MVSAALPLFGPHKADLKAVKVKDYNSLSLQLKEVSLDEDFLPHITLVKICGGWLCADIGIV